MTGQVDQASSESFERLNQASVALLEPLLDASIENRPERLAARFSQAIAHCARTAESVGLRSLNYLCTLIVPYLQRQAQGGDWAQARERLEGWVGDVVAFCAGQLPDAEAAELVLGPLRWPEFPAVPEQFVTLITGRLRQDAQVIAVLAVGAYSEPVLAPPSVVDRTARDQPAAMVASIAEAAPVEHAVRHEDAAQAAQAGETGQVTLAEGFDEIAARTASSRWRHPEFPTEPARAARDEFRMLAEATDALADEVDEPAALELLRERLGNLENAAGFVGVDALVAALRVACEALDAWIEDPARPQARATGFLAELATRLSTYLRAPSYEHAFALSSFLAQPDWPVALSRESVSGLAQALSSIRLVESRQVAGPTAEIGEDDLSLSIPADTDARTVDTLLRELPALSAQFSESIERGLRGSRDQLVQAQRIAHTLKGSANTVGVRGVATLTHQLEDLLQVLVAGDAQVPAELGDRLAAAADCLGEMTDAVAGVGEAPADSMEICRSLGSWIARLLDRGQAAEAGRAAPPGGPVEDESRSWSGVDAKARTPLPVRADGEALAAGAGVAELAGTPFQAPAVADADAVDRETPSDEAQDQSLRVPASLVDRMLDLSGEASMLLAQAQEQLAQIGETRGSFRLGAGRLQELTAELERLVDVRGVSLTGRGRRADFDTLELDEFNELHTVSRRIAEAGADGYLLGQQLDRQAMALTEVAGQLERVQAELRDAVMRTRTLPASSIVPRLRRAVRAAARMAARQASLSITGEATGIDAQLLQALIDPLMHLLRNAVDHGIESPQERAALGKPLEGSVRLAFTRVGRNLRISCRDDGRGLDEQAIRERAMELGLIEAQAQPRSGDLARAIMHPGFSTRREATQLSGRGIGLDIVQQAVTALRGTIDVHSTPGGGTEVVIEVPERMASLAVAVARSPSHVLALSIRGIEQLLPADGVVGDDTGTLRFAYEGGFIAAEYLDERLGLPRGHFEREQAAAHAAAMVPVPQGAAHRGIAAIVRRDDAALIALITPELGQTRSVVVRPLPGWMPRVDAIEGATVLGDGAVAPVIDLPALLARAPGERPTPADAPHEPRSLPVCLVVDDSVSVRRSMQTFMRDLGFAVDEAGDGIEALARVDQRIPDLAIIDLEMPRMNGIDLAATLRSEERTHRIGLIMITSRYSEKHRAMALDAGVDVFMTKPYTEDELAASVAHCLRAHTDEARQ